jgi:uncharacterized protein
VELTIPVEGAELPATLTLPLGACRAGVVVLHGAEAGQRSYFLYEHLAEVLGRRDVAVLRYDRRDSPDGHDVPLQTQAADVLAATRRLRDVVSGPVGLWGYSQGAWVATLAAATDPDTVAFLICVSCCGVSPAVQMRFGCANQLRKHGFSEHEVEDLVDTRLAVEGFLRSGRDRESVQAILDRAAAQPWFAHAYLPPVLPSAPASLAQSAGRSASEHRSSGLCRSTNLTRFHNQSGWWTRSSAVRVAATSTPATSGQIHRGTGRVRVSTLETERANRPPRPAVWRL